MFSAQVPLQPFGTLITKVFVVMALSQLQPVLTQKNFIARKALATEQENGQRRRETQPLSTNVILYYMHTTRHEKRHHFSGKTVSHTHSYCTPTQ